MSSSPNSSPQTVRRNGIILLCSMIITFALLRSVLHVAPNTDLNVGRYNIHHLFTGLLLIVAGGIPLAIFQNQSRWLDLARLIFGAGLGMALDEWVFLIATDGSNASYLLPVSFWGGFVVVGLACVYTVMLLVCNRAGVKPGKRRD
jgi:hypothetical protein